MSSHEQATQVYPTIQESGCAATLDSDDGIGDPFRVAFRLKRCQQVNQDVQVKGKG
jgi:hypothetical protein